MKNEFVEAIREELNRTTARSAWEHGVRRYEKDLISDLYQFLYTESITAADLAPQTIESAMLNGASDWSEYSWGGCSLIYDGDIARRLCNPSELKRTREGQRQPNNHEQWLDVQARALYQAAQAIKRAAAAVAEKTTAAAA